jgi:3-hydroxyisobutyrate dehydrogenase-like beta-hydroxyacid dehydrogenase
MNAGLSQQKRIGLLYSGEMGGAVAQLLRRDGCRLLTTLEGRGTKTVRNSRAAGLEELDCLREVVRQASMLFVLVPPAAALDMAIRVQEQLAGRGRDDRLIYVDANSVSPETVRAIASVFDGTQIDVVDAAISGPASRLACPVPERATSGGSGRPVRR